MKEKEIKIKEILEKYKKSNDEVLKGFAKGDYWGYSPHDLIPDLTDGMYNLIEEIEDLLKGE